jgi:uncharacterized protein
MLKSSIQKYPLTWFYTFSVFIVIAIVPIFILTGVGDAVDLAFKQTGLPFNTDLVTWFRLIAAFPSAFPGAMLALFQVAAPDIAVAIVVGTGYGRNGFIDLKKRFRFCAREIKWQQASKTWATCILVFAAMSMVTAGLSHYILPVDGFVWEINLLSVGFLSRFLVTMFLDGGALFEENGWRGFALPILIKQFNPFAASIILGLMWAFWHIPVKFDLILNYGFGNFVLMFSILTVKFVLLTTIMTYFWNRLGQTTIVAIVMHGLSNDSVRLGGNVLSETFQAQLQYEINLILPMLAVTLILLGVAGKQLGIKPKARA